MKRAFIQVPYAVLSRILFGNHEIGIYRVEADKPGPNGHVEFIVYASENSEVERGEVYQLHISKRLRKMMAQEGAYAKKEVKK